MKQPLVTITRPTWRSLIHEAAHHASQEKECYGHLVGRYTRVGAKVHHAPLQTAATCTADGVYFTDEAEARRVVALRKHHAPLEVLGTWHSHVFDGPYFAALRQQLSDSDQKTTGTDQIELVLAVMPRAEYTKAPKQEVHNPSPCVQSVTGKHICRAEAWLKRAQYLVVPCRIRVR